MDENLKLINLKNTKEEINVFNQWQTHFRISEFNYDMINQSIRIDSIYHTRILLITSLDQRDDFILDKSKISMKIEKIQTNNSPIRGNIS